jgi:hypothetical protein
MKLTHLNEGKKRFENHGGKMVAETKKGLSPVA